MEQKNARRDISAFGIYIAEQRKLHGHYAVQGHSRSPILVPIESPYATSYWRLILTCFLSCTVSKLWPIIGQIFAIDRGCPTLTPLLEVIPCEYRDKFYLSRN